MQTFSLLALGFLTPLTLALQATTTRYFDGSKGACGCGYDTGSFPYNYPWETPNGIASGVFTAAGSPILFEGSAADNSWCGAGCGLCYELTSTGSSPCADGSCGTGGAAGESIIVMVTNLCPAADPNLDWCQAAGEENLYGYMYHFDIMTDDAQPLPIVFGDNPVVDFEQVACPSAAASDYATCQCA